MVLATRRDEIKFPVDVLKSSWKQAVHFHQSFSKTRSQFNKKYCNFTRDFINLKFPNTVVPQIKSKHSFRLTKIEILYCEGINNYFYLFLETKFLFIGLPQKTITFTITFVLSLIKRKLECKTIMTKKSEKILFVKNETGRIKNETKFCFRAIPFNLLPPSSKHATD